MTGAVIPEPALVRIKAMHSQISFRFTVTSMGLHEPADFINIVFNLILLFKDNACYILNSEELVEVQNFSPHIFIVDIYYACPFNIVSKIGYDKVLV